METRRVEVTGVTGRQDGSVARALLHHGHALVGLTRSPPRAQKASALGAATAAEISHVVLSTAEGVDRAPNLAVFASKAANEALLTELSFL